MALNIKSIQPPEHPTVVAGSRPISTTKLELQIMDGECSNVTTGQNHLISDIKSRLKQRRLFKNIKKRLNIL